jgi:3-oxoacyl-[acyl-carrier-protein] synthase-1
LAQKLFQQNNGIELIIIGGLDSYRHSTVLSDLSKQQRIAMIGSDGFVAGEGAGFLVVTNNKKYALTANKGHVRLHPPGLAVEQGYIGSQEPNLAQGLTSAIKTALDASPNLPVNQIYSSMNGEAIWYEEHVASTLRHRHDLGENIAEKTHSSAYNIGDIGSASGALSIALSAHKLFSDALPQRHLITTSSDKNQRSAICLTFELAEAQQNTQKEAQESVYNEQDDR